jgi:MFS family permease
MGSDPIVKAFSRYFHYGFVVLLVATLGKVFTSPGQSPCIGVIIEDVRLEVNITRSALTGYYFAATTTSALLLPIGGKLIDYFGPRIMVTIFASGLGLACFVMSWVQKPGGFHLYIALLMLRFFGQGNMMNVSICEINYWWVERRGAVMGIAGAIVSSMMLGIIPIIMINLISNLGWRSTYQTLGLSCFIFMAPIGLLFFRGKPERYNLLPDGKHINASSSPDVGTVDIELMKQVDKKENLKESVTNSTKDKETKITTTNSTIDETNWTAKEVFHSRSFWVFALSDLIIAATATAFFFHLRGAFRESGVSDEMLQSIYPTLAVVSVAGRLLSGWLIDRITQRNVMWIGLLMQAGGLGLVSVMKTDFLAYFVALLIGASGSFCSTVRATVYAEMYGRKYLGSVQSFASSLTVLGSALGPFPFGVARDKTGSYTLPFAVASVFPFCAAITVYYFGYRGERCDDYSKDGFVSVLNVDGDGEVNDVQGVDGDEEEFLVVEGDSIGNEMEDDDLVDEI